MAAVATEDSGFLRGEGVFETMLAKGGAIFELERHWKRLARGCERFGIGVLELAAARPVLEELLERNHFEESQRVRVRVTRSRESLLFSSQLSPEYPDGLCLQTTEFCRNERSALAGVKAISYGENALALARGRADGAHEVLFANTKGEWCEGAWSNIFAVEKGRLLTPPLASGCLPGVTRELVLEVAGDEGIEAKEEARSLASLEKVEELFLTSSLLGIGPVTRFDGRDLERGPVTLRLQELLRKREESAQGR